MVRTADVAEGAPVGVLLVGGFLGAGKTTLLRRLVADRAHAGRLAVLVNELGALGLDGELIRAAREGAALRTVQLDSGCLCCTLRGELGAALAELARPADGPPPDQIVVELSGAALASEVHFQVATQSLDAPYFADGLVCLVDAQAAPRWAREAEALFVDQLTRADLVLFTKLDIATAAQRAESERLVARIAPGARVAPSTHGDVPAALLLGTLAAAPPPRPTAHAAHALAGETVEVAGPLDARLLEDLLEDVSTRLYRVKGLVDVRRGAVIEPTLVQCVGDQIALRAAPELTGPRRLTFIGPIASIDRAALAARLHDAGRSA